MKNINELTEKRNPLAQPINQRYLRFFLDQINADIREIQALIAQYNLQITAAAETLILNQIEQKYQSILNKYPASYFAYCADFSTEIQTTLFNEIKIARAWLRITSVHAEDSLPGLIENMPPEKITQLMDILNNGSLFDRNAFYQLYDPADDEYDNFQAFLDEITDIKFLGGENSKNFKITYPNGDSLVLKLEYRLDQPAQVAVDLQSGLLNGILTPIKAKREGTFTDHTDATAPRTVNRSLIVTDFSAGGDLAFHGASIQGHLQKAESALTIYSQMATILTTLTQHDYAFPDMKNTNWLIDDTETLKIADTKSLIRINRDGKLDFRVPENQWCTAILSGYMNPPELNQTYQNGCCSADKMHVCMLGKNLYQYLTGCSYTELETNSYEFDRHDVFKTNVGKVLQKLIQSMVRTDPKDRVTTKGALSKLQAIQAKMNADKATMEAEAALRAALRTVTLAKIDECNQMLDRLKILRVGKHDSKMDQFHIEQRLLLLLMNPDDFKSADELHKLFSSILTEESTKGMSQLNSYLTSLRRSPGYYFDRNNTYRQIKDAILNIPIEERGSINKVTAGQSGAVTHLQALLNTLADKKWLNTFYATQGNTSSTQAISAQYKAKIKKTTGEDERLLSSSKKKSDR